MLRGFFINVRSHPSFTKEGTSLSPSAFPLIIRLILFGVSSGLLLVLSLPKPDLYPLAWIALTPLLFAIARAGNWRRAAVASYAAGVMFFAGTFYWITETMMIYGEVDTLSAIGVGALFCITYALHFVLFGLGVWL